MSQAYASWSLVRSLAATTAQRSIRSDLTCSFQRLARSSVPALTAFVLLTAVAGAAPQASVPPTSGAWIGDPPAAHAPVGVNLAGVDDWSTEWVFVDVMKSSRPWLPQLAHSTSPWNTGAYLQLDADGWPILAPGQAAATVMMVDSGGTYPAGKYVCLYEGQGKIELGLNATTTLVQPGRLEAQVNPTNAGILLRIVESHPSNPVRNVRLIMPGFEHTYQQEPFHPLFLQRIAHYQCLRFMDWMETNDSPSQHWQDRTKPTSARQTTKRGVAAEHIVGLANRTGKDPWVCMPHLATDDYMRQFATLVRDSLHPTLDVYIEYSNEVWNGIFDQSDYAQSNGMAAGFGPNTFTAQMRWYSQRSVQMFEIWVEVFGGHGSPGAKRVKRVLAGQSSNPWTGELVMDWNQAYQKADMYAIAPYFGGYLGNASTQTQTASMSVQQILDACSANIAGPVAAELAENSYEAKSRGLELIAYEGGQHLVGVASAVNNSALTAKFIAANRDPGMYYVYRQFLSEWKKIGGGAFVAFSSTMTPSKWGAWGALEYQTQPTAEAHKFRALADFISEEQSIGQTGKSCGPVIGSLGEPAAGGPPMLLLAANALPGAPGIMLASSQPNWGSIPLPLDLAVLGAPGCQLLVAPDMIVPVLANGQGMVALPLTASQPLTGMPFHFQFAFVNPWANASGVTYSNALHLVVQP